MSDPAGTSFDGGEPSFRAAYQNGPTIPCVDPVTRGAIYKQIMRQRMPYWRPLPWSTGGPGGSYLVEETDPSHVGVGLIEWQRIFCAVPPPRVDPETCVYAYQYRNGSDLGEVTLTVKAQVTFTYYHTLNPETDIPLTRAFRWFKIGENVAYIGSVPDPDSDIILGEDETYKRFRGNIYEKRSLFVPTIAETVLS